MTTIAVGVIVVAALSLLHGGVPTDLLRNAFITYNAICLAYLLGPIIANNILDELKKAEASTS